MQCMRKKSFFSLAVLAVALPICEAMFKGIGAFIACHIAIMTAWVWLPTVALFCCLIWSIFTVTKDPPSSTD